MKVKSIIKSIFTPEISVDDIEIVDIYDRKTFFTLTEKNTQICQTKKLNNLNTKK
jgi:hypothetical protein